MKGKQALLGVLFLLAAILPTQGQQGGRTAILRHALRHPHLRHRLFFHQAFVRPIFLPFVPPATPVIVLVAQSVFIQILADPQARADPVQAGEAGMSLSELDTEQGLEGSQAEGQSGWLGVMISDISGEKAKELKLSSERGVLVTGIEADSPAAKAGLRVNDVILEFDGQGVEGTLQFRRLVRETPPGRRVQLSVWRDASAQTVSVELGRLRAQTSSGRDVSGPPYGKSDIPSIWRVPAKRTRRSPPLTLLVFKDNSIAAVTDYWIEGGRLHYTAASVGESSAPVEQVDLEMTAWFNWERGTRFALRPTPSAR